MKSSRTNLITCFNLKDISEAMKEICFNSAGKKSSTVNAIGNLRLEGGDRLDLRDPNVFKPLWVTDFHLNLTKKRILIMLCTILLLLQMKRTWSF